MLRVIQFFVSFYYRSADTLGSEWRQVVTFSGDSDSVRFDYRVLDEEGDPVVYLDSIGVIVGGDVEIRFRV